MTVNPHIGEVSLTLTMANGNRRDLVLKPTPGATNEIEQTLGLSIIQAWYQSAAGGLKIEQTAVIVLAAARAAGQANHNELEATAKHLQEPIFYTGVLKVNEVVSRFLATCCNAGMPPELLQKKENGEEPTLSIGGNGSGSQPSSSDGPSSSSGTPLG